MRTARKNKKCAMTEDILQNVLLKYNFKLVTAINFFDTSKKRLLMLVYQAEVITFPKIMLSMSI